VSGRGEVQDGLQIVDWSNRLLVLTLDCLEIDAANAGELRAITCDAVAADADVALDLSELQYIDSAGLGALLALLRQLNAGDTS